MTDVAAERATVPGNRPPTGGWVALPLRALGHWMANYKRTWRERSSPACSSRSSSWPRWASGWARSSTPTPAAQGLGGFSYLEFLAPGLLAANAVQTAMFESTYPVMGGTKWDKKYFAQIATPLRPSDVFRGHLIFIAFRIVSMAAIFLGVMAIFGVARTPAGDRRAARVAAARARRRRRRSARSR